MDAVKFECEALSKRDGILLEHIGHATTMPPIYHDFTMFAYVAHGEGFHSTEDETLPVSEGDVFLINADTVHCFYSSQRSQYVEMYYCYFLPDKFKRLMNALKRDFPEVSDFFDENKMPYLHIADGSGKKIRNLFVRMLDEFARCGAGYTYTLASYLTIALTLFLRRYTKAINNPVFNKNQNIDEIIRYINFNLPYGITVAGIAEAFHISEPYLCRLFKNNTGMTVTQYINNLRIENAKDLLKNTNRSINTIASTLNCSAVYLQRLFKKSTGMSLIEYRKNFHYKS